MESDAGLYHGDEKEPIEAAVICSKDSCFFGERHDLDCNCLESRRGLSETKREYATAALLSRPVGDCRRGRN